MSNFDFCLFFFQKAMLRRVIFLGGRYINEVRPSLENEKPRYQPRWENWLDRDRKPKPCKGLELQRDWLFYGKPRSS